MLFSVQVIQDPGFLVSRVFRFQVFQGPGQGPGPGFRSTQHRSTWSLCKHWLLCNANVITFIKITLNPIRHNAKKRKKNKLDSQKNR